LCLKKAGQNVSEKNNKGGERFGAKEKMRQNPAKSTRSAANKKMEAAGVDRGDARGEGQKTSPREKIKPTRHAGGSTN